NGFSSPSPQKFLNNGRSVIVGLLNYYAEDRPLRSLEGSIARYTRSNYYHDIRVRLRSMVKVLKRGYKFHFRVFSNGPLAEKPLAVRAGLGYYGKHAIIINDKFGSWFVIGEIVTDLEIEPDKPTKGDCGDCRLCIDACPTDALNTPYRLDWKRCIQFLSNHRAIIPEDIRRAWGNRLYGCTTCQEVCPRNQNPKQNHPIPEYGYIGPGLPLCEILSLDEQDYRARYGRNQIGAKWVELACLKRNAILALANLKAKDGLNHIRRFENDPDPMLAEHARWAIGEICRWV
ncbi:MAG TPA: tRNA epoxyqueuosine(34) reductase QueG, partial [bacterium (Candidatus Stahlbacteria)]|nr:tRNA epoxyqueuosine(34) reductase QueG [Candidatus Stahlbacteria bacterium]